MSYIKILVVLVFVVQRFQLSPKERTLDVSASYLQLYCVAEFYSLGLSLGKRNNKVVYNNAFKY